MQFLTNFTWNARYLAMLSFGSLLDRKKARSNGQYPDFSIGPKNRAQQEERITHIKKLITDPVFQKHPFM